jgi:hypothetical protein
MYKLTVHFTQRTQYMQYSTGNSYYLIAEVMYYPLHFCNAGVHCLRHLRFPAHASFLPVLVMHVLDVPNLRGRLIYTYGFNCLFLCPHFLPSHVCSTALNYTVSPGLVQVAAESESGASLHGNRKCSQAGCPLVNSDLGESALEGGYT